jgi:hypothetical protein
MPRAGFTTRWPGAEAMTTREQDRTAQRGFHLNLPQGFVTLPLDDVALEPTELEDLKAKLAEQLGIAPTDEGAQVAAASFSQLGSMIGDGGIDYSAIALYKSLDDPLRPIMVTLTGLAMPSDHRSRAEAISSLIELHSGADAINEIRLPSGPAVTTVTEEQNALIINDESIQVLTRQLSAWVPDREGTTIGVISVITNSFQDWERVCVLAGATRRLIWHMKLTHQDLTIRSVRRFDRRRPS